MSDDQRSIELEVEVAGTPDEVWRAIATGPGMQIAGRVAVRDPPHRVLFDGGDGLGGLAFEWLVEAREGDTCLVRLVNSGFGAGADSDAHYDGMSDGWTLFLLNLKPADQDGWLSPRLWGSRHRRRSASGSW